MNNQFLNRKSFILMLGSIIWGIAALFFLYEFFLRTFVGTIATQIIPDLNLTPEKFAIMGSAYYITYGIMQVPVGILIDKFSVKWIMVFATLVCAAATLLFAHATGFKSAFASRLFMGFGSSFAFVCLLVIAITWFPKRYFAFFAGLSQFVGTIGPLLAGGPFLIFLATAHSNWRVTLSMVGLFGVVLAILSLLVVRNKPRGGEQALIYLKQSEGLFVLLKPLIKNPQVWYVAFYSATVYTSLVLLSVIWGTDYLEARGLTQTVAADVVSLSWFGYAIGCPLLGVFSDVTKRRKPTVVFCASFGLLISFCITYLPIQSTWVYSLLFIGLGIASTGQNLGFAVITEHVDIPTKATALGLNNGMISLFSSCIPPLATLFIHFSSTCQLAPSDFTASFTFMPILYISALLVSALLIKETYCKPQKEAIILKI